MARTTSRASSRRCCARRRAERSARAHRFRGCQAQGRRPGACMNRATLGALAALLVMLMPATALAQTASHGGPCPTDVNCTGGVRNDTQAQADAASGAKHVPAASLLVVVGVLATSAILLLALRKR